MYIIDCDFPPSSPSLRLLSPSSLHQLLALFISPFPQIRNLGFENHVQGHLGMAWNYPQEPGPVISGNIAKGSGFPSTECLWLAVLPPCLTVEGPVLRRPGAGIHGYCEFKVAVAVPCLGDTFKG